ncbi:MAG: hypothetical protein HOU81_25540 [Hamadaea sp.]|uniref:hypothetical protein n=1 Tax=Hamadaea sp. TaxID=2024425 RepID=UPI0018411159|nr:hypothetical protein [Hamadaea sp.]NUR74187.1 hypothetical protein [Hamadaea sp.]NUT20489.1 hypothetical protein [Hamadaea sp.]
MSIIRAGVNPPLNQSPQGILVGFGSLVVIVAGFVASAFPQAEAVLRYGVLVLAVLAFAAVTAVWTASLVTAVIGFLVFDGFLVNQLGQLSWHGSTDAMRLMALGSAVIAGRLAGDLFPGRASGRPPMAAAYPSVEEDEHDA